MAGSGKLSNNKLTKALKYKLESILTVMLWQSTEWGNVRQTDIAMREIITQPGEMHRRLR